MIKSVGASVEVRDIRLRFAHADHAALENVSLKIEPGETLVVLGPSGCGKSTLLHCMNRLLVPDSGSVLIDGIDIAKTDIIGLRRTIGYVIQAAGLFPHMSVRENVGFVLTLQKLSQAEIDARVDEVLETVRLDPKIYRDRSPNSLSGGEAQRVGVARAFAARPILLLMDEPFGALDPVVRHELQIETRNIIKNAGTTTVFVTHDVDEALRLADRILVMKRGGMLQIAAPLDMLRAPANKEVADLIGSDVFTRRLRLLTVASAVNAAVPDMDLPELPFPENAALDVVLNAFLSDPKIERYRVTGRGTIGFADIADALRHAPAASKQ
jgi:osmoprotectant transport system ATP-binding protein